jgi:hypothetical protein
MILTHNVTYFLLIIFLFIIRVAYIICLISREMLVINFYYFIAGLESLDLSDCPRVSDLSIRHAFKFIELKFLSLERNIMVCVLY